MKKQVQNSDVMTSTIRFTQPPPARLFTLIYTLSIDADKKIALSNFFYNFQLVTCSRHREAAQRLAVAI
jgi:hypothetical protein